MQHTSRSESLLDHLNPAQRTAVCHGQGPILIFAGAGSGKTRVLTHRIAYLIAEYGISATRILAVTFTNKAAREMRERTESLLGRDCRGLWIGTFHSCCARMLREAGQSIGVPPDFVIFDTNDQMSMMREILKEQNLDQERYPPKTVLETISKAKERLQDPSVYSDSAADVYSRTCARVYRLYEERLRASDALDFDDLLLYAVRLLHEDANALQLFQTRFQHILVDEYQDINYAQYRLIHQLAAAHRNICVVGDDDQSIYAFRGADVNLILRFERDYPEACIVTLDQNYRSTQTILDAAHAVVSRNPHRRPKRLWTSNGKGSPIQHREVGNEQEEAIFVVETIGRAIADGRRTYRDFAVLYRTNAQSRAFEEVFVNFGVPHRLVGARPFYQRKEVKDVIAYLRLVRNPHDAVSLKRVINVPARGIGATSLQRLELAAKDAGLGLWAALNSPQVLVIVSPRARNAIAGFTSLIQDLCDFAASASVAELAHEVIQRTRYIEALQTVGASENRERIENVKELLTVTQRFDDLDEERSLAAFLEQVALVSELDDHAATGNAVTLMTLHASKGLEFPVVFMVGMEQGLLPHSRALQDDTEMEEERRLCYVGITRAKEELYVTNAYRRNLFGLTALNAPSVFLREMGVQKEPPTSRPAPIASDLVRPVQQVTVPTAESKPVPNRPRPFRDGARVSHHVFGKGIVISVRPSNEDYEVTVSFPDHGIKKLLHSMARLQNEDHR
ncbi:MAG: UvrD-helicase domain-containing protein [Chthonomonadales bacterium]|nr:UvrD-helicase domain-containing protein [Chthonomonadales bacterium]